MDYACTALTTLSKTQRHKPEVIQNRCVRYVRRAVDSTCISNNELHSYCNIASVEHRIFALTDSWWKKASKNNDDIINFTYQQSGNRSKIPLNVVKGNRFL